ncbi:MAG: hypothetical protein QXW14_04695, partial [Candidatus Nitrosocaldus sp.]
RRLLLNSSNSNSSSRAMLAECSGQAWGPLEPQTPVRIWAGLPTQQLSSKLLFVSCVCIDEK